MTSAALQIPQEAAVNAGDSRPAVVCRGVTKTYGAGPSAVKALRGVDLEIGAGELMMLVGPSGCGKTSLISVIAGVLDRDGGECTVFGEDFAAMKPHQRTTFRGKNIGFVFQAFNLIPTLSIAENVAVPLLINGWSMSKSVAEARGVLGQVGLADRWHDHPSRLSGGQQQRVAIARALIHHPRLIVCDEPTSALDHETGEKVMELLRATAVGKGRTLVVVTHDARIFGFADRIAKMDDGSIVKIVDDMKELT